jgi:uncharacterized protein YidB (DUF937 family)
MRLLHEVIGDLHHHAEEHAITPIGHVLEELLEGERGFLHDLADRPTQTAPGSIMACWTGHGSNLPIPPEQLRHVLGEERVQDMAILAGVRSAALLDQLSRTLPRASHAMTPEGDLQAWQWDRNEGD